MSIPGDSAARTAAQLDTAARLNPSLAALISIFHDDAMACAHAADRAAAEGRSLGPLHGMTVSIKDNIDVAGRPTTAGAAFLRGNVATQDAPVVACLRAAGATIVGKANMAELAFGSRSYSAVRMAVVRSMPPPKSDSDEPGRTGSLESRAPVIRSSPERACTAMSMPAFSARLPSVP